MPINMAGTKMNVPLASSGSEVIAGPGQKPETPQPKVTAILPIIHENQAQVERAGKIEEVLPL